MSELAFSECSAHWLRANFANARLREETRPFTILGRSNWKQLVSEPTKVDVLSKLDLVVVLLLCALKVRLSRIRRREFDIALRIWGCCESSEEI